MAKITVAINDDATQNNVGDAAVLTDATKIFGTLSTNAEYIGMRFVSVGLPQGTTIRHAYLKVYCASITISSSTYSLNGEDADNSTAFSTGVNDISGRTLTTASFFRHLHDLTDGYRYFDVTDIVQEIVNRAGWASGNAIAFIFNTPSTSANFTISMSESTNDPEFGAIYGDVADSVRSPSVSGTGTWTNPDNAFSSNDTYATTANTQTASQIYESFNIADLSSAASIEGVLITCEAKVSSTTNISDLQVEASWDGGTSWTTGVLGFQYQTTDSIVKYGGAASFSHSFTASELTNTNFKVRITTIFNVGTTNDLSFDHVTAQVFYTAGSGSSIKTVTGLAIASVSTVKGLARASVKTINGLA